MCQKGMGHVECRDEAVRTLPEPKVGVQRVAGAGGEPQLFAPREGSERNSIYFALQFLRGGTSGAAPVADTVVPVVRGGEPDEERRGELDSGVLLERIYEILTKPGFSDKPDELAMELAKALSVKLPAGKHLVMDAVFVARLKAAIFRVADANGMDEESAMAAGLLSDFME